MKWLRVWLEHWRLRRWRREAMTIEDHSDRLARLDELQAARERDEDERRGLL